MVAISVIVPVRDDPRLAACLAALAGQTLSRDRFEVVVADDGGDPTVRALADRHAVAYVVASGRGSYAARMAGLAAARGAIVAFTDADCVPPPTWLESIDGLLADRAVDVLVGPSGSTDAGTVATWVQAIDDARWARVEGAARVAFCDTRNLALRRAVLDRIPLDASFRHAGDLDLGLRLRAAGVRIRPSPELRLLHDHPRSLVAVLRRAIRRGRGLAALERKHGTAGGWFGGGLGERPLTIRGRDAKAAILRLARNPVGRVGLVVASVVAICPLLVALAVIARLPVGTRIGLPAFVAFERLGLLLGRLVGPSSTVEH